MTKLIPCDNYCVINLLEQEDKKSGLIVVPTQVQGPTRLGIVLEKGPKADETAELDLTVGDKVMFHKDMGIPFFHKGETLFMVRATSFYCVVKEEV